MKRLFLAAALVWGLCAPTSAQVVFPTLSGNESWQAGQGPGGPGAYITSDMVRGSNQIAVGTFTGSATVPSNLYKGGNWVITAQPSAGTVTMPPSPVPNGTVVGICNPSAAAWATNVVTVAGNTGQTSPVNATITTLAAGYCAQFQYQLSNTSWYRVQ